MRTLSKLQNERDTVEALVTGHPRDVKKVSSLGLLTYEKVKNIEFVLELRQTGFCEGGC